MANLKNPVQRGMDAGMLPGQGLSATGGTIDNFEGFAP